MSIVTSKDNDALCGICIDDLNDKRTLPCGHEYCSACVNPWLCGHNTCPTCRANVQSGEQQTATSTTSIDEAVTSLRQLMIDLNEKIDTVIARRSSR